MLGAFSFGVGDGVLVGVVLEGVLLVLPSCFPNNDKISSKESRLSILLILTLLYPFCCNTSTTSSTDLQLDKSIFLYIYFLSIFLLLLLCLTDSVALLVLVVSVVLEVSCFFAALLVSDLLLESFSAFLVFVVTLLSFVFKAFLSSLVSFFVGASFSTSEALSFIF